MTSASLSPTTPLRVYLIEELVWGERHHYAAESADEALALFVEDIYGGTVEGYCSECPETVVAVQADEQLLTISYDEGCCPSLPPETKTMREWAVERGKGCICTTAH